MTGSPPQVDVVIAGAGLAGIVTACELLDHDKSVLLIDKDPEDRFGGLAREAFGGIHLIDTPHQRRLGLRDTPELAWQDWQSYARWNGEGDRWPRRWAQLYCQQSIPLIFEFLTARGVRFMPLVNWPERGWDVRGNSLPRWHVVWGTGYELAQRCIRSLLDHPGAHRLQVWFEHEVNGLEIENRRVVGVRGRRLNDDRRFRVKADQVVIASGGIGGGDLTRVRSHWPRDWPGPPEILLNGAHRYGDGMLHDQVAAAGGQLTHLDRHWLYAAGIHHPAHRRPHDGLSLVPPRSALWFNARGARIGPRPLVAYTDTRHLVKTILSQPGQYSWQVMNWKIAIRELAVSGAEYMPVFRSKSKLKLLRSVLFGNPDLIRRLERECPDDFVVAATFDELTQKMNERSLTGFEIDPSQLRYDIETYDAQIQRGKAFFNDEQLRWLINFRTYRGDRVRTCKYQAILDPRARPLIAVREFILTRKSLGGIQTNLQSQVLDSYGQVIPGLYAVGEAAGFGGGGIHGKGSLEGTFLGACILTGRVAGRAIAKGV